jgi:hypothetical protein
VAEKGAGSSALKNIQRHLISEAKQVGSIQPRSIRVLEQGIFLCSENSDRDEKWLAEIDSASHSEQSRDVFFARPIHPVTFSNCGCI